MSDKKFMEGILEHYDSDTKLDDIFMHQYKFGKKFCDFEMALCDPDYQVMWTRKFADCIMDELSELLNWLPWKHWKNYENHVINEVEVRFELIDILHFAVSLCLLHGILPDELVDAFGENSPINIYVGIYKETINDQPKLESIMNSIKNIPTDVDYRIANTYRFIRSVNSYIAILQNIYRREEMKDIILDIMRNLFTIFHVWGMTAEDIFDYYMSKNRENFNRQERGY